MKDQEEINLEAILRVFKKVIRDAVKEGLAPIRQDLNHINRRLKKIEDQEKFTE